MRMRIELNLPAGFDPAADGDALGAAVRAAAERFVEYGHEPTEWQPLRRVGWEEGGVAVYRNDRYTVRVTPQPPPVCWHLAVCRNDRGPLHDWRDLQRVKNELCGPDCEAVELYPAEERLVDAANTYHLWVFPPGERLPFGMAERRMADRTPGSVQRPHTAGAV